MTTTCRICGSASGAHEFAAREMMFGTREPFRYLECHACGCLQIIDPPRDLSRYYPQDYYAFKGIEVDRGIKRYLKRMRGRYALDGTGWLGRLLASRYGLPAEALWAKRVGLKFDERVLDVGCGIGLQLLQLSVIGFRNLQGIDPYIEHDYQYENGVRIAKRQLNELTGSYDFIMFHHSFEHMADPAAVLDDVQRLLAPGRFALIRIPVAQTHAWKTYGPDWVQLDAPRHLFLQSERSMQILADRHGFVLEDVGYDSSGFQFWGSEQYRRNIPLMDERSVACNPNNSIFSEAELRDFEAQAAALNLAGNGDQACFYLRKRS